MKRATSLGATAMVGRDELIIEIQQAEFGAWTLELSLLICNLVAETRIQLREGWSITLSICGDPKADRTAISKTSERAFVCELSRTQIGYLQMTLLRAYRDAMAEVNHIHIEGLASDTPFDLTVMFDVYRAPMSAEEAEKALLGDEHS